MRRALNAAGVGDEDLDPVEHVDLGVVVVDQWLLRSRRGSLLSGGDLGARGIGLGADSEDRCGRRLRGDDESAADREAAGGRGVPGVGHFGGGRADVTGEIVQGPRRALRVVVHLVEVAVDAVDRVAEGARPGRASCPVSWCGLPPRRRPPWWRPGRRCPASRPSGGSCPGCP